MRLSDEYVSLFLRLQQECRRLGGKLVVTEAEIYDHDPEVQDAPFEIGLGIKWEEKEVHISPNLVTRPESLAGVIHEMGHVFVDLRYGEDERPGESREFNFVGWEFMVALKLNCVRHWYGSMANYSIVTVEERLRDEKVGHWKYGKGNTEFCDLDRAQRRFFLTDRVAVARKKGFVKGNIPLTLR